jgi:hypothetical protein
MSHRPVPGPTDPGEPAPPPDPARPAADADLVPGDPPVPITVWRTPAPGGAGGGLLSQPLATRLIAGYTRRGDTVVDATGPTGPTALTGPSTGDPVLAGAATAAGRAHRAIPRRGRSEHVEEGALVVCGWPLPRAGLVDPVIALGGLRRRLRPGGALAVIVSATAPGAGPAEVGPLVRAAAAAGLCYLQHIVAVHAATDGEDIVPAPTQAELAAARARVGGAAHLRAHTDVLVFTRPGHARA